MVRRTEQSGFALNQSSLLSLSLSRVPTCCPLAVAEHRFSHQTGPIPWMAPETFDEGKKGHVLSPASDVYMLGSCFVELATGCERQPFDWLAPQDVLRLRYNNGTRGVSCLQV